VEVGCPKHYNVIIEHVPGALNVPADVFSWLAVNDESSPLNHIMVLTTEQASLLKATMNGCAHITAWGKH